MTNQSHSKISFGGRFVWSFLFCIGQYFLVLFIIILFDLAGSISDAIGLFTIMFLLYVAPVYSLGMTIVSILFLKVADQTMNKFSSNWITPIILLIICIIFGIVSYNLSDEINQVICIYGSIISYLLINLFFFIRLTKKMEI